jgi:zinc carboxypeptidase
VAPPIAPIDPSLPQTVAESSGYTRTSRHVEVLQFIERLARLAPLANGLSVQSMGRSALGQEMPVLVLSSGGHFTPVAAHASRLPIVMVLANIHAGEVEGKEAVLKLAREIAAAGGAAAPTRAPLAKLMERAVLLLVPNYNCDGNDKIDPANRILDLAKLEGQCGPKSGVGTRNTAQGFNLNRDYVKLDAPESRRLMDLWHAWRPHLTVDCHTTNGSLHGYHLTYDTAHLIPSSPAAPILHVRDVLLPELSRRLEARTGYRTWYYGNFRDHDDPTKGWESYPGLPRFGSHYRGLAGRMDVLLECYSYLEYRERCDVMHETLVELLTLAAEQGDAIVRTVEEAEAETVRRGTAPQPDDVVGVDYTQITRNPKGGVVVSHPMWPLFEPDGERAAGAISESRGGGVEILAWDLESMRQRRVPGRDLVRYPATYYGRFVPTRSVRRPFAYLIPASWRKIADHLRLHHLQLVDLTKPQYLDAEEFVVDAREATSSPDIADDSPAETILFGHWLATTLRLEPGDVVVPMAQPLAHVALYLLEPESDDGLVRWRFFDEVKTGEAFPVRRIPSPFRREE